MRFIVQCLRGESSRSETNAASRVLCQRTHAGVVAPYRSKWRRNTRRQSATTPQPNTVYRQLSVGFARIIHWVALQQHLYFGEDAMPARAVGSQRQERTHVAASHCVKTGRCHCGRRVALQKPVARIWRMQCDVFLTQMICKCAGKSAGLDGRHGQEPRIGEYQRIAPCFKMTGCSAQPVSPVGREVFAAREHRCQRPILLLRDAKSTAQQCVSACGLMRSKGRAGQQRVQLRCVHRTPQGIANVARRNEMRNVKRALHVRRASVAPVYTPVRGFEVNFAFSEKPFH